MTALVLCTNPQRAAHRYPTRSSSCTTEATVSLITSFPRRKLLYFVFSLHWGGNATLWTEQGSVPTMPGRCWGDRGQAVCPLLLHSSDPAKGPLGQAVVRVKGGKIFLCLELEWPLPGICQGLRPVAEGCSLVQPPSWGTISSPATHSQNLQGEMCVPGPENSLCNAATSVSWRLTHLDSVLVHEWFSRNKTMDNIICEETLMV